ncbi:hypothetical protein RFI_14129 [Reticulomyxa filosa]|uniref:Uncharacterized protein n=1 Tax=Reticulomyxa filosa TaxID=46433 RepID=X6NCK7_RETFI|nr:hypothetical protein RFI_14129 [Reticulomyxa filosa]|eukprot:ETO23057.1 hypothetical protein RFI_14129 [Reticulomyxa filosa]
MHSNLIVQRVAVQKKKKTLKKNLKNFLAETILNYISSITLRCVHSKRMNGNKRQSLEHNRVAVDCDHKSSRSKAYPNGSPQIGNNKKASSFFSWLTMPKLSISNVSTIDHRSTIRVQNRRAIEHEKRQKLKKEKMLKALAKNAVDVSVLLYVML